MFRIALHHQTRRCIRSFSSVSNSVQRQQQQQLQKHSEQRKRLDVAIVGLPNAGKSQLLNVLTKSTVAAVSRKRHTTRDGVLGYRTVDNTQLVFLDTPGFLTTRRAKREGLDRELMTAAVHAMDHVDYTLLVVDAAKTLTNDVKESLIKLMFAALEAQGRQELSDSEDEEDDDEEEEDDEEGEMDDEISGENVNSNSSSSGDEEGLNDEDSDIGDDFDICKRQKFSVVLNKVDLVHPKSDLIDTAAEISDLAQECLQYCSEQMQTSLDEEQLSEIMPTFFYICARNEEDVEDVLQFLLEKATPCKSWDVEAGESSNMTPEERVEEIIREKIYRCLHKEVPYSIRQQNRIFRVGRDKEGKMGVLIHQDLIVRTPSHRDILFGTGSRTLKRIQETAEASITELFGCKVVLQLHVRVLKPRKRKWSI